MRMLMGVVGVLSCVGCAGQQVELNPMDVAAGVACVQQVQALAQSAQVQVSACVDLGKSIAARVEE